MASLAPMLERLPTIWRPEPGAPDLVTALLSAAAREVDALRDEASLVLQAHWYPYADASVLDPYAVRVRQLARLPALTSTDLLDAADPAGLVLLLRNGASPLAVWLRGRLPDIVRTRVDGFKKTDRPGPALLRALLDALGTVVRGGPVYDGARFAGVTLDPDLEARAQAGVPAAELPALNVELLLAAFPAVLRRATLDSPYLRDLGRIGALVPLTPWRDPPALRESVEAFRLRIARMVALYREGLGTVGALRGVLEATLPVDLSAPPELRDRPFAIEELAPLGVAAEDAGTDGPPAGILGPLMRWTVDNPGLEPARATVYIEGVAADPGKTAATDAPMVERLPADGGVPVAVGYTGTVTPGKVLRLRPAWATWLVQGGVLFRGDHLPTDQGGADPTTPGPFAAVPGAPADPVVAIHAAPDGALWVGTSGAAGGAVWRFDGAAWTEEASALPAVRCLAELGTDLLVGTAAGLLRRPLWPAQPADGTPVAVVGLEAAAVNAIEPAAGPGERWIGTDAGAFRWSLPGDPEPLPLGGGDGVATAVRGIHRDASGFVYFAAELGVFFYQPASEGWYWYGGAAFTEQEPEWIAFGDGVPSGDVVFLPPARCVLRGPDAALWIGTDAGLARYIAASAGGAAYTTRLEAFPDLGTGAVAGMLRDERGGVLFATASGLLRFDGRDLWQRRGDDWARLGRADLLAGAASRPRGSWRFDRGAGAWQRFEEASRSWVPATPAARASAEPALEALLQTDAAAADLGSYDGDAFAAEEPVPASDLFLHVKPAPDRIAQGGIPYVPRVPVGASDWRYLQREPDDLVEAPAERRPAWTPEGRLLPPPPELAAPYDGRFDIDAPPEGHFDQAVFTYDPSARVRMSLEPKHAASVLVRLRRLGGEPAYDPVVLDRVWAGIQQVRPAGVIVRLAVEESLVRGDDHGSG